MSDKIPVVSFSGPEEDPQGKGNTQYQIGNTTITTGPTTDGTENSHFTNIKIEDDQGNTIYKSSRIFPNDE